MADMSHRERVRLTLAHQEADRVALAARGVQVVIAGE
jgi:hypothetical protein